MLRTVSVLLALSVLRCTPASAADQRDSAPLPTQIGTAKRVFLSNMGGECQNFNSPGLNFGVGQPLRHGQVSSTVPTAYDSLYSALKEWGRFDLVLAPGDADLIFQIHVVCPSLKEGHSVIDLQILDRQTRIALWGFSQTSDPAELQRNRDANFQRSVSRLTGDLKALFARADAAAGTASK